MPIRIATCTPVNFEASPRFFSRDTGLLCRGFQAAGVDCVVVMPGTYKTDDVPDLVRCSPEELESAEWWKALNLSLVVLYAWGDPRYLSVATAIRSAGIPLVQSMDTAGLYSPFAHFGIWLTASLAEIAIPQTIPLRIKRLARVFRDLIPSVFERRRLIMMAECDALAVVSPPAETAIAAYAQGLGFSEILKKLIVIPHPVSKEMYYSGETKINHLLVVGRWGSKDAPQKNPQMTIQIVADFLRHHQDWTAEIIGPEADTFTEGISKYPEWVRHRLTLCNFVTHSALKMKYATSRIILCASRFESFHIASAEALCCGCSVVVAQHPLLASTAWFTTRNSGTLATSRKPPDLVQALLDEARKWEEGERSADQIADAWIPELRADLVAANLIQKIESKR